MENRETAMINEYKAGKSMTAIANEFDTYSMTVKRILEKNGVELRHDNRKKGYLYVKDGEKLIEWAKAQGRLVTKAELAKVLGKTRLSPSYFIKYPELGQYVQLYEQKELSEYILNLRKWLNENKIPYKPNDRLKLGVTVDTLLLGEYEGIALQIAEKPTYMSKKIHKNSIDQKLEKAKEVGLHIILLNKKHFEDLDKLKPLLDDLKR